MKQSRIEITGFTARFYDLLVLLGTAGLYQVILKKAIKMMHIQPRDRILDLGAGTGKNACFMHEYLLPEGSITALEIGSEMQKQFHKKCDRYKNVNLADQSIEEMLPYAEEFDKVLLSFVIHGFTQDKREKILKNAYKALKPGGKIYIFDWNEFDIQRQGIMLRFFMKHIECQEASDFIKRPFKDTLLKLNYVNVEGVFFALNKIRLLIAQKPSGNI